MNTECGCIGHRYECRFFMRIVNTFPLESNRRIIRGDSDFSMSDIYKQFEGNDIGYVIRLKKNDILGKKSPFCG